MAPLGSDRTTISTTSAPLCSIPTATISRRSATCPSDTRAGLKQSEAGGLSPASKCVELLAEGSKARLCLFARVGEAPCGLLPQHFTAASCACAPPAFLPPFSLLFPSLSPLP